MSEQPTERTVVAVYDALAAPVLGYFRSHGIRDADDLVGDVFEAVTRSLDRFRGDDDALRRWVFTIAHNRMVDEFRRRGRRREDLVGEPPESPVVADGPDLVDPQLIGALAELTDDQREVVVLRFVGDLSIAQTARIMRRRQGAVKMLQARALARLEDRLGDILGSP